MQIPIFDGHNDTLLRLYRKGAEGVMAFFTEGEGHLDLPRARRGGMAGGLFAIFPPTPSDSPERDMLWAMTYTEGGYRQPLRSAIDPAGAREITDQMVDLAHAVAAHSRDQVRIIIDADALEAVIAGAAAVDGAKADGDAGAGNPFAMVLHLEGAEAVGADLSGLEGYYERGVRSLGIVWSRENAFGFGVPFSFPQDPDTGPGLTEAGRDLVRACNRLGIMVDLAHLNAKGFWDVQKLSTAPLVVTHAGVFAICPSTRNLTDDQIRAVGETGGVIGLIYEPMNLRAEFQPDTEFPLAQLVRHIRYIAEKIGVDHVALGSDFDGADMPAALSDASRLPALIDALAQDGFTQEEIEKVAFRNWLRVLRETWGK